MRKFKYLNEQDIKYLQDNMVEVDDYWKFENAIRHLEQVSFYLLSDLGSLYLVEFPDAYLPHLKKIIENHGGIMKPYKEHIIFKDPKEKE